MAQRLHQDGGGLVVASSMLLLAHPHEVPHEVRQRGAVVQRQVLDKFKQALSALLVVADPRRVDEAVVPHDGNHLVGQLSQVLMQHTSHHAGLVRTQVQVVPVAWKGAAGRRSEHSHISCTWLHLLDEAGAGPGRGHTRGEDICTNLH